MNIKLKTFNSGDKTQLDALINWDCDQELFHLITPIPDHSIDINYPSREELMELYQDPFYTEGLSMIYDEQKPIGYISVQIDPPQLMKKLKGTIWMAIVIGDRDYWGSNAATKAIELFEQESLRFGRERVEIGTFGFNIRAQKFFQKLGYKEIGRFKDFTYHNGEFWDNIRMEKTLRV